MMLAGGGPMAMMGRSQLKLFFLSFFWGGASCFDSGCENFCDLGSVHLPSALRAKVFFSLHGGKKRGIALKVFVMYLRCFFLFPLCFQMGLCSR
jgi:hypothetical protein